MTKKKMKAWTHFEYGSPSEVLELKELEIPHLKENELLIKVKSISLNPAELHKILGEIWFMRPAFGLRKPNSPFLGSDMVGEVVEVFNEDSQFKVGDTVFGRSHELGLAEYATLKEINACVVNVDGDENSLASLPLVFSTAYHSLIEVGKLKENEKVLINGASGGIGTIMIQLAKIQGAQITAVSSKKNHLLLSKLGATKTIEYQVDRPFSDLTDYDLVVDLIGNLKLRQMSRMLNNKGRAVVVGFSSPSLLFGFLIGKLLVRKGNQKYSIVNAETTNESLNKAQTLFKSGKIKSIIDREYPFEKIPEAFEYLRSKRAVGKIVVKVR